MSVPAHKIFIINQLELSDGLYFLMGMCSPFCPNTPCCLTLAHLSFLETLGFAISGTDSENDHFVS